MPLCLDPSMSTSFVKWDWEQATNKAENQRTQGYPHLLGLLFGQCQFHPCGATRQFQPFMLLYNWEPNCVKIPKENWSGIPVDGVEKEMCFWNIAVWGCFGYFSWISGVQLQPKVLICQESYQMATQQLATILAPQNAPKDGSSMQAEIKPWQRRFQTWKWEI